MAIRFAVRAIRAVEVPDSAICRSRLGVAIGELNLRAIIPEACLILVDIRESLDSQISNIAGFCARVVSGCLPSVRSTRGTDDNGEMA